MITSLTKLGNYGPNTFHLLELQSLTSPWPIISGAKYFRLIIFCDTQNIGLDEERQILINNALASGARSILCSGTYCSHLHDEFDLTMAIAEIEGHPYCDIEAGQVVMTTWHEDEPVDEILWTSTLPGFGHEDFQSDNTQIVIALLANDSRISEIHRIARSLPDSIHNVIDRE